MKLTDLVNDVLSAPQWTLFLDRDGVINERIVGGYVLHYDELKILPFVKEALHLLKGKFYKIVVVSNQQSVGKGLCQYDEVVQIHNQLNKELQKENIAVDHFFFCPHKAEDGCECRKPKTGMAFEAQKMFPEIDFKHSIMVGDMITDIQFGHSLGMTTISVGEKEVLNRDQIVELADFSFENLYEFAQLFKSK